MFNICCGRSLKDTLKSFALLDLFLDNIQVAIAFTSYAFPGWLPDLYYQTKVYTLQHTFGNSTAPVIYKPQENPSDPPPEGESHFILFLTAIGLFLCLASTTLLFYWLWTGTKHANLSKCKKWLCVRVIFLSFLVLVTIYKLSSQNYYYAFDGVFDLLKIYSVYEILLVKKFIDTNNSTPILIK